MKHDFYIAGRWRNWQNIKKVLDLIRENNFTAYCFIENRYKGEKVELEMNEAIEGKMQNLEALDLHDPLITKIFEIDMEAEKNSEIFLAVFPFGISVHMEAGVAYGLGKKCYAIGTPEKTETLYQVFDEIFPDLEAFKKWLQAKKRTS